MNGVYILIKMKYKQDTRLTSRLSGTTSIEPFGADLV